MKESLEINLELDKKLDFNTDDIDKNLLKII